MVIGVHLRNLRIFEWEKARVDVPNLLAALSEQIGGVNVLAHGAPSDIKLPDGWTNRPVATVLPGNADEIAQVVVACESAEIAIVVVGGGTKLQTGYPPREKTPYILLSTSRMNRVLDYQPDDLTITCEPGMTLAQVQAHLHPRRQFLQLDVPLANRATVGGIVSAGQSGFERAAYGAPRDLVIGLHAVMTGGTRVKGGGKVVKNVAGYDVCKLFTGAWGTAGVITEVTFRVRPLPEAGRVIRLDAPDMPTAARAALVLHHAQIAPIALLATNEIDGKACLLALLHGTNPRMDWQTNEMQRLAGVEGLQAPVALPETEWESLGDAQARLSLQTPLAGRIACLLSDVEPILCVLQNLPTIQLTADCALGIIAFAAHEPDADFVQTVTKAVPATATLRWTRVDGGIAAHIPIAELNVWGHTRESTALQRALKQAIDPKSTFSPGRFVGGL